MNEKCIDCTTCAGFAPETFARGNGYHYVHTQPDLDDEAQLDNARAALLACPVAAIRIESKSVPKEDIALISRTLARICLNALGLA